MQQTNFVHVMERPLHIFKMSGDSPVSMRRSYDSYKKIFLDHEDDPEFANAAFTANVRPDHFSYRDFILARDFKEAADKLKTMKVEFTKNSESGKPRKLCFLFPGYGCQYAGMARELYDTSPVFRKHFERCCGIFENDYEIPLKSVIFDEENVGKIHQQPYGSTGIFTIEYSLLKLWESFGIKPNYVLGHSIGEIVAAVAAGFLTFDDAIKVVAKSIKLVTALPKGAMLVLKGDQNKAKQILEDKKLDLDIAALNNKLETVIAGDRETICQLNDICKAVNLPTLLFDECIAGHSRRMDPVIDDIRLVTDTLDYKHRQNKNVVFISSVTGRVVGESELNSEYWATHVRQPVNFILAVTQLAYLGVTDFLEVGPGATLSNSVLKNLGTENIKAFSSIHLRKNDWEEMLNSLGNLYLLGYKVDWEGFDAPNNRKKVTYLPINAEQQ